jgi:hypothetical protein
MFQLPSKLPITFTSSQGPWVEILSPNDGSFVTSAQEATLQDIEKLLAETRSIQKKMAALKQFIKKPELVKAFKERDVKIDTGGLVG